MKKRISQIKINFELPLFADQEHGNYFFDIQTVPSGKGGTCLMLYGYKFTLHITNNDGVCYYRCRGHRKKWVCIWTQRMSQNSTVFFLRCPARIKLDRNCESAILLRAHNHEAEATPEPEGEFWTSKWINISLNLRTVFVGTDITEDIVMMTNTKGSTVIFYDGFKYLKSGGSKSSFQYRCANYMKKCRSRIIFNRENETSMANEIGHNHDLDSNLYNSFAANTSIVRRFGRSRNYVTLKGDDEPEKWEIKF